MNELEKEQAENVEPVVTSEWLRENTKIHGWLSLFLFAITLGGAVSLISPIINYDTSSCGGAVWVPAIDVIFGAVMLGLALTALYSFVKRLPSALFYGRAYLAFTILSNVALIFLDSASDDFRSYLSGTLICVVWLIYLSKSEEVKEVIPKSFRKVSKRDRIILAAIAAFIVVVYVVFVLAFAAHTSRASVEKYAKDRQNAETITSQLAENEKSDGRIIFAIPENFSYEVKNSEEVNGSSIPIYTIFREENGDYATLCSDYEEDQSIDNFDLYWSSNEDPDALELERVDLDRGTTTVNGHKVIYRIVKFNVDGRYVYWRFYMMFDKDSDKMAAMSCYDEDEDTAYVMQILNSIRFE